MHCLVILALISTAVTVFSEDCKPGTCEPDDTCCPTDTPGAYGCCPFKNAVCCEDHAHCCPPYTECDVERRACIPTGGEDGKMRILNKLENRRGNIEVVPLPCTPETCESELDWDCCMSLPGTTNCCIDIPHCCPRGKECVIEVTPKCTRKQPIGRNKMQKRQGPLDEEENLELQCGDGSLCRSGNTCCIVAEGKYGCCPHPQATCCPDGIHCCPQNELCDLTSRYCVGKLAVHPSAIKEPARPIHFEDSA